MTTLLKAAVVTASDRSFRGERPDQSGLLIKEFLAGLSMEVAACHIVPDEKEALKEILSQLADEERCDLILTTGGTGLAPRDVTPDATREILEREIPGIPEAVRAVGMQVKMTAALSRGIAGVRGRTLIINLPGSPRAIEESFPVLRQLLIHAVESIRGEVRDCQTSLSSHRSHSS